MNKNMICSILWVILILMGFSFGEDLPVPSIENAVIISIEHEISDTIEVEYIKNHFNFGLYAWLSFSRTSLYPVLDWHASWDDAQQGVQAFKDRVDLYVQEAKTNGVRLHIVLCSGLARGISIYREAKEEDIRNCQWYNDNKLASDSQILEADAMNTTIFGTLSRYARKMRANLEAKARASLDYLRQKLDEEPGIFAALSGWGEPEMNSKRLSNDQSLQDYFCDYSPFAVLEFRDWICHTGMYDTISGKYGGQGYSDGGSKYQDAGGLELFNQDFGTSFETWDLKYYNWSLDDDYDTDPTDDVNGDPNLIPFSSYTHGGMMPGSGESTIAGGFDPPRVMEPGNAFWDLWNLFRETMVHNFVRDMAGWVAEAGIPPDTWYSHQIPADYLFGTNPDSVNMNPRYHSSASPLWSADIQPSGSMGASMYDIKFPGWFARTTKYGVPAIASRSPNWGIMEYDAETYPSGYSVVESDPELIFDQFMNVYNHGAHLINFWKWWDDSGQHRIKGMNKEIALRDFVEAVRDKGRNTDPSHVFDPPKVEGISGYYDTESGAIVVEIGQAIWPEHSWEWADWGDFSHFEIHRSTAPDFTPDDSTLIHATSSYVYHDTAYFPGNAYVYKVRSVNVSGTGGPFSDEILLIPSATDVAVMSVSEESLLFGAEAGMTATSDENVIVWNLGPEGTVLNWTAVPSKSWILIDPVSGTGDARLKIGVNPAGMKSGTYSGEVTVYDPDAFNSPRVIQVILQVYPLGGDSVPFGRFDTPREGVTVSANVPVTGWALDDIEVTRVQIKRSSHPDDPPAAIGPDGLVFVGDAVFVKGARPDVEGIYPAYPKADRAGWGYMMLTNLFPNQGNGPFTLYAFAYDGSGHRILLGQKNIICDNANRTKPFGTIDTPKQGGIISGDAYVNFGWALTPQPKFIPEDGSTILVWVDGVPLGHPAYGNHRVDIATKFPGYANSEGAVGYYFLDTTQYTNGVHKISWSVEDNMGERDGIGGRKYEIYNVGGAVAGMDAFQYVEDPAAHLTVEIEGYVLGWKSWLMSRERGLALENPRTKKDESGESAAWITMEEADRLELHFGGQGGNRFIGWGRSGSEALPEGSTLDEENGVFYWTPPAGFLGEHVLHFAATDGQSRSRALEVVVHIVPKNYGPGQRHRFGDTSKRILK